MRLLLIIFYFFLVNQNVNAEDIVIKYIVNTENRFHPKTQLQIVDVKNRNDNFISNFMNISNVIEYKKTLLSQDSSSETYLFDYKISKAGLYFFTDGTGKEILLSPEKNDTIVINLSRKHSINVYSLALHDSIAIPWFTSSTIDNKHFYINFFDSLAQLYGDINIRMTYSFKTFNNDLPKYLSFVNKVYKDRLAFLNDFEQRHYFPNSLRYYVFKEIQYCYYSDLLEPILYFNNQSLYPTEMLDSIKHIGINMNDTDLFNNTSLYKKVIEEYLLNFVNERNKNKYRDSTHLRRSYDYCKINLKGVIKDYMMSCIMKEYITYDPNHLIANVYKDYTILNKKSKYYNYIDSLYGLYVLANPLTAEELLKLSFEDSKHQSLVLKSIINKKLVIIDCWATWCIPCIKEQPYLDVIYKKYKDKIQFISLSADQQITKWDSWINKNQKIDNEIIQFHAVNGFENIFFKKLKITAIPRYILLNKDGEILNASLPFPSEEDKFIKTIEHFITQ